ncbi:sialate O-acetylesterase [Acinetobacter soli]|uniref:sialate O-acetylesterase n=1 Tax=Acinetobacter soli TaxID=487316 RepID=UPI0004685120|nr:sialate O-acetylesterase [Acinetobacter soli]
MPLPNILEFIGNSVTQAGFKTALEKLLSYLNLEGATKAELNAAVTPKADKTYVDTALSSFQNGAIKTYPTLAAANADIANIQLNSKVSVLSVTDGGDYYKASSSATNLTKSPYDALSLAKADASTKADAAQAAAVASANANTKTSVNALNTNIATKFDKLDLYSTTDASIIPVLVDADNKVLIGYNPVNERPVLVGVGSIITGTYPRINSSTDPSNIAVLTDAANRILIGYDTVNDKPILAGLETSVTGGSVRKIAAVNHILFYGQSLTIGSYAVPISLTQPYQNLTFNNGPLKNGSAASTVPLIEMTNETPCSSTANYASRSMLLNNQIQPNKHVIFSSTAGIGGAPISLLTKGAMGFDKVVDHVTSARNLVGSDYKMQALCWAGGETDAHSSTVTPYSTYKTKFAQLQVDVTESVKAITGQDDEVLFITYQLSSYTRTWKDVALAQLHLVQENDKFSLSTPMYHMPYDDGVHLTGVGYKWLGAYFGRAYKQRVVDNRKPDFLNPKIAYINGSVITINFDVPTLPLVLDTTTLAATTDHGFKILEDSAAVPISQIEVIGSTVKITVNKVLTGNVAVRYALDYMGTGLTMGSGASGNLRDSTSETVVIQGVTKPLYHICPHFELNAVYDKGI